jgi:hypothetical protein
VPLSSRDRESAAISKNTKEPDDDGRSEQRWTGVRPSEILTAKNLIGGNAVPVTVKKISLWRKEDENKTGLLAQTLEPLAKAGANLGVVMGYRLPGNEAKAAIEIYPVSGKKVTGAARGTGLADSAIPTLLVEGDNKQGLAHKIAQTLAEAGADLNFFVAVAIGRRYSAVIGFANDADAKKAATLIKKAGRK